VARQQLKTLMTRAREIATPAPPAPAPPQHPGLALPVDELADIAEMIALGEIVKAITRRHETVKLHARAALFRAFTGDWWKRRRKPENPRIVIPTPAGEPDHDTLYQLRDQYSLSAFPDADSIAEALAAPTPAQAPPAEDAPLTRTQATHLVQEEIASDPTLRLRYTLTELAEGHSEENDAGTRAFVPATKAEQAIAAKLLGYLLAEPRGAVKSSVTVPALTHAEREHILVLDPRLHFKDPRGFPARLCGYVSTLAQLRRVLLTFRPTQLFSGSHFALAARNGERSARLMLIAAEILGAPDPPPAG
jgi:hypothetical protein